MENVKTITLKFDLGEVCNDILAKCNLIGQSVRDEALADIRANIMEPDGPETRSIICRAVTESFGKVKVACSRWLKVGRSTDTNSLERLVKSVGGAEEADSGKAVDSGGKAVVVSVPSSGNTATIVDSQTKTDGVAGSITEKVVYEVVTLVLSIPNFNTSVTDHLKSMIHKYVVDWCMYRFLQDQHGDKAGEYKTLADGEDYSNILSDLNIREKYNFRKASWI